MARVPYDPNQTVLPNPTAGNDYISTQANPADFGAQVGAAAERVGQAGQQFSDMLERNALERQGMVNQTMATDASTQHEINLGSIKGQFKSLEGLAAQNALPDVISQIQASRQNALNSLPNPAAKQAFALLSARQTAYAISDVNDYAATQVKAADLTSAHASAMNAAQSSGDFATAQSDQRFNDSLHEIDFNLARMLQNRGYGSGMTQDPSTGAISFDESTPQGQGSAAVYKQQRDQWYGQAWENRIHALADDPTQGNVLRAQQVFQDNRDRIPPEAQMKIAAYLQPKVRVAAAYGVAGTTLSQAETEYQNTIGSGVHGLGPAAPAVQEAAVANGVDPVQAVTVAQIESKSGASPDRPGSQYKGVFQLGDNEFAQNGGGTRGNVNDELKAGVANLARLQPIADQALGAPAQPWQLYLFHQQGPAGAAALFKAPPTQNVVDALAPAYSGNRDAATQAIRQNFGNPNGTAGDFLHLWQQKYAATEQNVRASLTGITPVSAGGGTPTVGAGAAPTAALLTRADFYRMHEADIISEARQQAEFAFPDDPQAVELSVARTQQQLNATIRQQDQAYKADNDTVWQALNGDLAKGVHPTTIDQLRAVSPQAAAAWDRLQAQQPEVAHHIATTLMSENAKTLGHDAETHGTAYIDELHRIHAAPGDPSRTTDRCSFIRWSGMA